MSHYDIKFPICLYVWYTIQTILTLFTLLIPFRKIVNYVYVITEIQLSYKSQINMY
jgi:hypothetical protein